MKEPMKQIGFVAISGITMHAYTGVRTQGTQSFNIILITYFDLFTLTFFKKLNSHILLLINNNKT